MYVLQLKSAHLSRGIAIQLLIIKYVKKHAVSGDDDVDLSEYAHHHAEEDAALSAGD